jgi:hypothetical protein
MMNTIRKFDFEYHGQTWRVQRARHLYEPRNGSEFSRDEFINKNRYIEVMKSALRNGLCSFREKGEVVITIPTTEGKYYSFLVALDEDNKIFVISVYKAHKNTWWKTYITCKNRINCVYKEYIIPRMNKEEKRDKQMDKVFNEVERTERVDARYMMNAFHDVERVFS